MTDCIQTGSTFLITNTINNSYTTFQTTDLSNNINTICQIGATGINNYQPISLASTGTNPTNTSHIGHIIYANGSSTTISITNPTILTITLPAGVWMLNGHVKMTSSSSIAFTTTTYNSIYFSNIFNSSFPSVMPFISCPLEYLTKMFTLSAAGEFNRRCSCVVSLTTTTPIYLNALSTGSASVFGIPDIAATRLS